MTRCGCERAGSPRLQVLESETDLSCERLLRLDKEVAVTMTKGSCCGGHCVTHPHEIARHSVCGLCEPSARTGKGRASGTLQRRAEVAELQ